MNKYALYLNFEVRKNMQSEKYDTRFKCFNMTRFIDITS